jgi:signal transduction histidine kinase
MERLEQADRQKDEFLALLGHELRTPLAAIQNALNVIVLPDATEHDIEEARQIAERQVRQMTRLMDDLLDVARISQGKMELRKKVIDVAQVIDRAVEACRPSVQERKQNLTVTVPKRPLWIKGDAARIEQAIANLLNNATKYTQTGGQIRVHAEEDGGINRIRSNATTKGDPGNEECHVSGYYRLGTARGSAKVKRSWVRLSFAQTCQTRNSATIIGLHF